MDWVKHIKDLLTSLSVSGISEFHVFANVEKISIWAANKCNCRDNRIDNTIDNILHLIELGQPTMGVMREYEILNLS